MPGLPVRNRRASEAGHPPFAMNLVIGGQDRKRRIGCILEYTEKVERSSPVGWRTIE
jgi:hypothetical protein